MSHISKIELKINDLDALKRACDRLGLQFLHWQSCFKWFSGTMKCDHAIKVPDASYEIGVVRKDKDYDLLWDDWSSGGLVQRLGPGAGLLKQAYTIERVRAEARKKNMRFTETQREEGIRLVLTS
mgnify:CR=1 FL=1